MMRLSHAAFVLVALSLTAALCGCASASKPVAAKAPVPVHRLVVEPQDGYQPIYDFISEASHTVDMTMYQLSDAKAQDALKAAAKRGVRVRVLLDSDPQGGGGPAQNGPAASDLASGGVEVRWAWPGTLWHQKSLVRDGDAAIVMTANLYAPYYRIMRDYAVVIDSVATARGMEATFDHDWNETSSPPSPGVIPTASELVWSPGAQAALVGLIDSARPGTTLLAEDEQLGSPPIEAALIRAAKRGVSVEFVMTLSPQYASALTTLAAGGVHVGVYQPNAPIYIHAKAMSVNGDTAYEGSANFTTAMTNQNRNVGIITKDPVVVAGITSVMASDYAGATPYRPRP
jgi:phosphatidylserine/phosphatidylglycerophosphate/cardiolipin synthase-like enzyme